MGSKGRVRGSSVGARLALVGLLIAAAAGAYVYGRFSPNNNKTITETQVAAFVGFEPAQIDLGDQPWAQVIPVQLMFVNRAASPIVIESAESSCDCTVIENNAYRGRAVSAGESLGLDVKLDTQKSPGPKARRVDLTTASGARYSAVIRVNVQGTWSLTPDTIDFGDVVLDDGEDGPTGVVVFESDADELKDVSAAGAPWLVVSTAPADAGRVAISLRVAKALLATGQNSASVVVETSCAVKANAAVYVKARAVHELSTAPAQVTLVGAKHQRVECTDRSGRRVRLVSADTGSEAIGVAVLEDGAVDVWNAVGAALPEPVVVRVADEAGRSRVFQVSAF
jgi:hypothetical protein